MIIESAWDWHAVCDGSETVAASATSATSDGSASASYEDLIYFC
jgi:hypothetical protein